jgi:predicted RNA-binding Zn ribbon-like protein
MSPSSTLAGLRDFQELALHGGRLPLDFVNSVGAWVPHLERDYLTSYDDLLAWSLHAGALTDAEVQTLRPAATRSPEVAQIVYTKAQALREALHRLFAAIAHDAPPLPEDRELLNAALASALPHRQLVADGLGFRWAWGGPPEALDRMLWPIAYEAAALLTAPELARVRECPAPDCGWLFLDLSKNRSRRWCSMETCGNAAKARRHYQRHKGEA